MTLRDTTTSSTTMTKRHSVIVSARHASVHIYGSVPAPSHFDPDHFHQASTCNHAIGTSCAEIGDPSPRLFQLCFSIVGPQSRRNRRQPRAATTDAPSNGNIARPSRTPWLHPLLTLAWSPGCWPHVSVASTSHPYPTNAAAAAASVGALLPVYPGCFWPCGVLARRWLTARQHCPDVSELWPRPARTSQNTAQLVHTLWLRHGLPRCR